MKTRNFWIAALSGAVLSLLVTNLPYLGFINCALCAAFWGSPIFAVWLYRRLGGNLTIGEGLRLGAITGALAGVLGLLLSLLGVAGLQWLLKDTAALLPVNTQKDLASIPASFWFLINLVGVLGEVVLGLAGGWIGAAIFRADRQTIKKGETK
jgi:hypothetical protein